VCPAGIPTLTFSSSARPRPPHYDDHRRLKREGLLDALFPIGRENDDSAVTLNTLKKMGRLHTRESEMETVDLFRGPEQRTSFPDASRTQPSNPHYS
jgi:hypothetical protein